MVHDSGLMAFEGLLKYEILVSALVSANPAIGSSTKDRAGNCRSRPDY